MLTPDDFTTRLAVSCETQDWLRTLTHAELADVVERELWAALPVLSWASDVLSEVIDRLRGEAP